MMLKYFNPVEFSSFDEPPRDTILHTIQSDILDMIDRGAPGNEAPVQLSKEHLDNDKSIIISSCHSPSREVEVLYDYILDLFNTDKTIGPGDILIMTPDIETYSPYIQAVFGSNADGAANIPFSVTDISLRKEISVIETFISILDISESRFEASRIIGLLENDDIAMKFDLSAGDVEIIRRWIIDTNIRWGINADEKKKLGLPAERLNTWEDGFDRLLAGYALPSIDESLFNGILPFDNIEGSDARTLGRFIRFFDILKTTGADLNAERTLVEWRDVLIKLIDNLFFSNENSTEMQTLINLINRLSYIQEKSGFDGTIDPAVIKSFFNNYSRKESTGAGFLTGNVTFCTMLPMRSIPHRIIGLIGMNGDSFPRITRTPNFNLISADPEPGDRSQRSDDRYLFLESIISARDKLYISYVGQSIRDNSDIPPSVVVSELLDYIDQAFASPGIKMKNRMIFKHRLQPFSPEYFKADSRLFSYSEENFNACFSMLNEKKEPDPFITDSLDDSINKTDEISLKDLINFFLHPAKYLVQKRLGLYLEESPGIINDREPFNLDRLSGYKIAQEIIEHYIEGRDINSYYKMMRATGAIPHGNIGDAIFKDLIADSSVFADKIMPHISPGKNAANTFSIDVSGIRLSGEIENLFPKGFVIYRYADVRAKDMIRAWINHLFLNSTLKNNNFKNSYLLCRDKFYIFRPVPDSGRILTNLINLFFSGQNQLIQFLTETSYEYAFNLFKGKSAETAFDKAVVKWNGSEKIRGEFDDPYYYICFNKTKPFDENFRHLAEEIYIPLLKCAGEI
jgi:exodeoxyribonuclease V gamma subunit